MPYDPTTPAAPYNHATNSVRARTSQPQKRYGDSSKTVSMGRAIYVFPDKNAPARRVTKPAS